MWRSFVLCVFLGGRKRIGFGRTLCWIRKISENLIYMMFFL